MRLPRLLLMFGLALAACSDDPSGPAGAVEVQVEVRTNGTVPGADVTYRIRNGSSAPVYLASCGPKPVAAIDRWEGSRWEPFVPEGCMLTAVFPHIELDPGEEIDAMRPMNEAGVYRLRPGIASSREGQPDWNATIVQFNIP